MKQWVFLLFCLILSAPPADAAEFRFVFHPRKPSKLPADVAVQAVSVAGSFNDWKADKAMMEIQPDGTYAKTLFLSPGVHHYKFIVNGQHWIPDPSSDPDLNEPDNFGGFNSGIVLQGTADAAGQQASPPAAEFPIPDWARHVVWYQIMPDRFRNGDLTNDPDGSLPWTWDWGRPYTEEEKQSSYGKFWSRQFGGDLKGLQEALDYLENLGVTGIYFNPIFKANGYSKYNTADYRHIDDHFGVKGDIRRFEEAEKAAPGGMASGPWPFTPTDQMFLAFLQEAHARGFKVILDGVFNHSGEEFWAFRDVVLREKESPYADWFVITDWDAPAKWRGGPAFEYNGWHGFGGLPEYREDNRGLAQGIRDHLFAITKRWMDPNGDGDPADGIDGWRLDAADDIDPNFWADWRGAAKKINPEAFLCGEIWKPAPELLSGRHFDALMNYPFAIKSASFFVHTSAAYAGTATQFKKSLLGMLAAYAEPTNQALMNLYASHDVDRLASMIKNPNRAYDQRNRLQDNPSYDILRPGDAHYATLKLMLTFQMTWVGSPMIWYGDEVGMFGSDDPANRMPMWWNDLMPYDNPDHQIRMDVLEHTRRLIALRNSYRALRVGSAVFHASDDAKKTLVFERRHGPERLIVALNNDETPHTVRVKLAGEPAEFVNLLDPKSVETVQGTVAGVGARRAQMRTAAGAKKIPSKEGYLDIDILPKSAAVLLQIQKN